MRACSSGLKASGFSLQRHDLARALETLTPEGVSYRRSAYFTTRVKEIGESRKLFVAPAGVTDGATVSVYVPEGVVTAGGCRSCNPGPAAPPPPPPQPLTITAKD